MTANNRIDLILPFVETDHRYEPESANDLLAGAG
jgi:hypothetical protein